MQHPLPDLWPDKQPKSDRNQAAYFNELHLVEPTRLGNRVACLSAHGINLLLQRWVNHNSRVIVHTGDFYQAIGGVFEEADIIEEWCEARPGLDTSIATAECVVWLRQAQIEGGILRQRMLEKAENRSAIRREMRQHLRILT